MTEKKKWDLTSTHSLEGATEWLRKQSGAYLVLVIRGELPGVRQADVVFATDPVLRPQDVFDMVNAAVPELIDSMHKLRAEKARKGQKDA